MAVKGVHVRFGTVVGWARAVALRKWMRGLLPVSLERWRRTYAEGMAVLGDAVFVSGVVNKTIQVVYVRDQQYIEQQFRLLASKTPSHKSRGHAASSGSLRSCSPNTPFYFLAQNPILQRLV